MLCSYTLAEDIKIEGRIIKTAADTFTVASGGMHFECRAKGAIKIKGDGILTGDFAEFDENSLIIEKILPRKNMLIRPSIANIDLINIVIANPPEPDYMLTDKLICSCRHKGIDFFITVNKSDEGKTDTAYIKNCYRNVCRVFCVSAKTGEGLSELKEFISGRLVCFAGQSAVGKTSIINAVTGLDKRTGTLSEKTLRGRHTTTVTEIIESGKFMLADTPGFSSVFSEVGYDEFPLVFFGGETDAQCRFADCRHIGEPQCAVLDGVENKIIEQKRYERYLLILKQLEISEKNMIKNTGKRGYKNEKAN